MIVKTERFIKKGWRGGIVVMEVQPKMRENHTIEGTLENVEVFSWREGRAQVSRVTIDQGSHTTSVPYFGALTEEEISLMLRKPVTFREYRKGLIFKEIEQELKVESVGICASVVGLAKSEAMALLRTYYPERK